MVTLKYDVCIVGAGIIGIAHAVLAIEKGLSVLIVEQEQLSYGASIRNFGLVWPIGQPQGHLFDRAMKSREKWVEMAEKAGFWALENGSLHVAHKHDEFEVLKEYHSKFGYKTNLLTPSEVLKISPHINQTNLIGGLFSQTEVNVDPKKAIYALCHWLSIQKNCEIKFGVKTLAVETGMIHTTVGSYHADQIYICNGADFLSLYPKVFEKSGLIKSKLQMMRTRPQPSDFKLGPTVCGGLTLRHYASFEQCETLNQLKVRVADKMYEYDRWGIHVMVSQNRENELVIGDSHEYGLSFDPFDKDEINTLILNYLKTFMHIEPIEIKETWHGIYAKLPGQTEYEYSPEPGVKIINGFGGAGMTFSFGYAIEEIDRLINH